MKKLLVIHLTGSLIILFILGLLSSTGWGYAGHSTLRERSTGTSNFIYLRPSFFYYGGFTYDRAPDVRNGGAYRGGGIHGGK